MVEKIQSKKIVLQHDDLWFDIKMHCTKSCRPFELFANENHELQNKAKMNVTFERGSARDPRRSPVSAELNDASARRIGVSVAQFIKTLFCNDSSC